MNSDFRKMLFLLFLFNSILVGSQTPVKQIEGLESITFYEVTGGLYQHTFSIGSFELNNRFSGHMDGSNNDFEGWANVESYDVFISDGDGTLNPDGSFITIEATFHLSAASGGLNIAEISYNFNGGTSMYGSYISSYQGLGTSYEPNTELNVTDCNLSTYSTMGHTSASSPEKLRVTIGFYYQESEIIYTGCAGDGYFVYVNGTIYDEVNHYGIETMTAMNGCDSIINIDLNFFPFDEKLITHKGCEGDGFFVEINGTVYDESNPLGIEFFMNQFGCDSIIIVDLYFEKTQTNNINYNGCEEDGYEISINGNVYNEQNPNGIEVLSNVYGCDSIVNINLIFEPVVSREFNYEGCENDDYSIIVNNRVYDQDNPVGMETLVSNSGCDSIVSINLTFHPDFYIQNAYDRCLNDGFSVNVGASFYDQSNPFGIDSLSSIYGCDSIIVTDIRFNTMHEDTIEHSVCSGSGFYIEVGDQTFNESHPKGDVKIIAAEGCDSIIHVNLNFKEVYFLSNIIQRCKDDGFYLEIGKSIYDQINTSGIDTLTSSNGCDSIVATTLYFNELHADSITYSGCQNDGFSIEINGNIYDEDNPVGVESLESVNGCDSLVYINLKFRQSADTTLIFNACKGGGFYYQVGNSIYNEGHPSGADTLISSVGCDSIIRTTIFFSEVLRDTIRYFGCQGDGYTILLNGQIYNESFPYGSDTLQNAFGCDSIILVDLHFAASKSTLIEFSGCDKDDFEVIVNGVWYGKENPKGVELMSSAEGCDSLIFIDLNYHPTYDLFFRASGCLGDNMEYLINGTIYNENNIAGVEHLLTFEGCDSIINIELNYYEQTIEHYIYEGCSNDGYSIIINNSIYDENNPTGTEFLKTLNGCDSIIHINLKFEDCDSIGECRLFVPNAFSPNDDRINDDFRVIENGNCVIKRFSVSIFDRWGNLVFTSSDPFFSWDGTKNNEKVLGGVYAYIITFANQDDKEKVIVGDVTIFR